MPEGVMVPVRQEHVPAGVRQFVRFSFRCVRNSAGGDPPLSVAVKIAVLGVIRQNRLKIIESDLGGEDIQQPWC